MVHWSLTFCYCTAQFDIKWNSLRPKNWAIRVPYLGMQGIGCDLVEVERLRAIVERRGQPFLDRIFTPLELAYCNRYADPMPHLAARFAAKEAIVKALGTGFGEMVGFKDVGIANDPNGKPIVILSARASQQFGPVQLLITLSHTRQHAMAVAYLQ